MVHFTVDGARTALTDDIKELAQDVGENPESGIQTPHALLVGRFEPRARVREGEPVEAVVDTTSLHFFDPETSLGIYDQSEKGAAS